MRTNITGLILATVIPLIVGLVLIIWPHKIKQYDGRVTRYIKDPEEYSLFVRIFGGLCLFVSFVCLVTLISSLLLH